jgi:hypothetical protein
MEENNITKRVSYKADVTWWDVDMLEEFQGRYTVREIRPENINDSILDVYYNINGRVHNLVTNQELAVAVKAELIKGIDKDSALL